MLPPLVRRLLIVLVLIGAALGLDVGFEKILPDAAWRQLALFAMVNVVVALSLNVINGMAGQFSLGHAGFVGMGAYTGAIVASNLHAWFVTSRLHEWLVASRVHEWLGGGDFSLGGSFVVMPLAILAAAVVAGLFGLVVGLPSLRLKGDYLAIVTLGFASMFHDVIATRQTGGAAKTGISGALASLGGANGYAGLDGTSGVPQYAGPFWVFGAAIVCTIIAWRLKFSGWGRALRALREDEIACAAVGVDPTRYKVTSFVISAAGAGVAGALLSSMRDGNPTVQPDQFGFVQSFDAITMVILGGSGSVTGAIVGGVFVTFTVKMIEQLQGIPSMLALKAAHPTLDLNAMRMVVYAALLITLMIMRPEGLFGERELFRAARRYRRKPKAPGEGDAGLAHKGAE